MAELLDRRDQEFEMKKVFRYYDDDNNGLISGQNIHRCAQDLEETVTN